MWIELEPVGILVFALEKNVHKVISSGEQKCLHLNAVSFMCPFCFFLDVHCNLYSLSAPGLDTSTKVPLWKEILCIIN